MTPAQEHRMRALGLHAISKTNLAMRPYDTPDRLKAVAQAIDALRKMQDALMRENALGKLGEHNTQQSE